MMTIRRDVAVRSPIVTDLLFAFGGAVVILLATQVAFYMPGNPVPITGQTFGVLVAAMMLGRVRGVAAVMMYLTAGLMGAPVFANFASSLAFFGDTAGYLIGFIPMAFVAGYLAEKGWTLSYLGAMTTGFIAHAVVLVCGALVLAAFYGLSNAWTLGVVPFLIGDLVKSIAAAIVVRLATSRRKE